MKHQSMSRLLAIDDEMKSLVVNSMHFSLPCGSRCLFLFYYVMIFQKSVHVCLFIKQWLYTFSVEGFNIVSNILDKLPVFYEAIVLSNVLYVYMYLIRCTCKSYELSLSLSLRNFEILIYFIQNKSHEPHNT